MLKPYFGIKPKCEKATGKQKKADTLNILVWTKMLNIESFLIVIRKSRIFSILPSAPVINHWHIV